MKTGHPIRIIGIDPGLRNTGWGVIDVTANRLAYVADGVVSPDAARPLSWRLLALHEGLGEAIALHRPDEAAVEEAFVNANPASTLKLGAARGIALLAPAAAGVPVAEYPANVIKKSLVGGGHAGKHQVQAMVSHLLPGWRFSGSDAADALAAAICHSHMAGNRRDMPVPWLAPEQAPERALEPAPEQAARPVLERAVPVGNRDGAEAAAEAVTGDGRDGAGTVTGRKP